MHQSRTSPGPQLWIRDTCCKCLRKFVGKTRNLSPGSENPHRSLLLTVTQPQPSKSRDTVFFLGHSPTKDILAQRPPPKQPPVSLHHYKLVVLLIFFAKYCWFWPLSHSFMSPSLPQAKRFCRRTCTTTLLACHPADCHLEGQDLAPPLCHLINFAPLSLFF